MIDRYSPLLTPNAISYTWRQLAQRIGGNTEQTTGIYAMIEGVSLLYAPIECTQSDRLCIVIVPCAEHARSRLIEREANSLEWLPADEAVPPNVELSFTNPVPVLFWGEGYEDGSKPFAERREDGTVIFYADILAATFFMLSRWEETVVLTRDQHGRFPATVSVAYKQGFLDRPIVDEYALILQAWLKVLSPNWEPQPRQFAVKLSHDIDNVRSASIRTLGGDIIKRRSLPTALQTAHQLFSPKIDSYLHGCYQLADLSERHGFESSFYFMAADRGPLDNGYDPKTKPMQRLIQHLRLRGHEIGFHPGYQTFDNSERFLIEKQRMDEALGETRYGGRQHFLRFRVPETWRLWEQAGLTYDSTLSYADYEGFRCGTCHPFHPFDIEQDRPLDLLEIPLIVMEGTLKDYRNLMPAQGEDRILTLAQRCKQVNGVFTLLWHNTSLQGEWARWANMYRQVLPRLAAL